MYVHFVNWIIGVTIWGKKINNLKKEFGIWFPNSDKKKMLKLYSKNKIRNGMSLKLSKGEAFWGENAIIFGSYGGANAIVFGAFRV